ncbi:MAG: dCTP deaminase [Candidatus Bathyarchaeia archaeon]
MLVDWEIKRLIELDIVIIEPLLELDKQLNPSGLDLHLDTQIVEIVRIRQAYLDVRDKPPLDFYKTTEIDILDKDKAYFMLHPGELVLARSMEYVSLPPFIAGGLDGRSSLGRIGVEIHVTAGSIDPGFKGHVTFELINLGKVPVLLRPGDRVARLILHVTEKAEKPYRGKYQYQITSLASRLYQDYR